MQEERTLGERIADSKPFAKNFNDPVWDWTTQRWKGSIVRDKRLGCNYYDFSGLRPILIHELHKPIQEGLKGDLSTIQKVIKDIDSDLSLRCGDLLQIGKTKNRGLFLVSTDKLLPITQLLGGNGFGEIPLNFLADLDNKPEILFNYTCDYWTYEDHPIISHVPYVKGGDDIETQNIRIGGQLFTLAEGSDCLKHPFVYLDFDNNEYFTLPKGIKQRFDTEIERIINSYTTGEFKQFLEAPDYVKPEPDLAEVDTKAKTKGKGSQKGKPKTKNAAASKTTKGWANYNRWAKKKDVPDQKQDTKQKEDIIIEKPIITLKKAIPAILSLPPKTMGDPVLAVPQNTTKNVNTKPKIVVNITLKQNN